MAIHHPNKTTYNTLPVEMFDMSARNTDTMCQTTIDSSNYSSQYNKNVYINQTKSTFIKDNNTCMMYV